MKKNNHRLPRYSAENIVNAAYEVLLGRSPDEEGRSAYLQRLTKGGDLKEIFKSILESDEFFNNFISLRAAHFVNEVYQGVLGRDPDEAAAGFVDQVKQVGRLVPMLTKMSASAEVWRACMAQHAEQLVGDAYRSVLDREPDQAAAGFVKQIRDSGEITPMLLKLATSEELWRRGIAQHAEELVGDAYRGLFEREPDHEAVGFIEQLKATGTIAPILLKMATSEELWRKSLSRFADQLVGDVYRGLLGREPDEAAAGFIARVKSTADLTPVLSDIAMSDELWRKSVVHRSEQLVGEAYRGLLGRELDGNAAGFIGLLKESAELTPVLSAISSSDELWRKSVAQRSEQLVGQAYRGLLGREPDENAEGLIGLLKESAELTPVLAVIKSSDELWQKSVIQRAEQLVGQVYRGMLAREPDEGAAGFVDQVKDSADLTRVISEIAASDELWRRTMSRHAEKLVSEVYRELLAREPDGSASAVVDRVRASGALAPLLSQIKASDELWRQQVHARSDFFVTSGYRGILDRSPDDAGLKHHTNALRSSQDFPAFLRSLTLSPEFLGRINGDYQATQHASVISGLGPYAIAEMDCIASLPYLLALSDFIEEKTGYKTVVVNRSEISPDLLKSNLNSSIAHVFPSAQLEGVFRWTSNRPKLLLASEVKDGKNRRIMDLLPEADSVRVVGENENGDSSFIYHEDALIFGEKNIHKNRFSESEEIPYIRGIVPWKSVFKYQRKIAESQKRTAPAENLPIATVMLFLPDWQGNHLGIIEDNIVYYFISLLSEHVGEDDVLLIKSESDQSAVILKRLLLVAQSAGVKAFDYEKYLTLSGYSAFGTCLPFEMTISSEILSQLKKYLVLESKQAFKIPYLLKNEGIRKKIHVIGGVPAQAFPRWIERRHLDFLEKESVENEEILRSLAEANSFTELSGSARWSAEIDLALIDFPIFEKSFFKDRKNEYQDKRMSVLFVPDQGWLVTVLTIAQDLADSGIRCVLVVPEKVEIEVKRTPYIHAVLDVEEMGRAIRWGNMSIESLYVHSFGWTEIVKMLIQLLPSAKLCYYADGFKNEVKKPHDMKAVEEIVYFGYKPFDWPVRSRLLAYDKWQAVLRDQLPIRFRSNISPVDASVLICLRYYGKGPYSFNQEQLMRLIWETAKPVVRSGCKILVKTDLRSPKLIDEVLIHFRKLHAGPVLNLFEEIGGIADGPLENIIETDVLSKITSYVVFDSSLSYIIFNHPMVRPDSTILVGAALESVLDNGEQVAPDTNHHDKQIAQEQGIAARGLASAVKSIQYYTERYVDSLKAEGAVARKIGKALYAVNHSDYPRDDLEWNRKYQNIKLKVITDNKIVAKRIIIGLGDSLVEMIPDELMKEYFPDYEFMNFGISGDCLPQVIWRTKQIPENCFESADIVLLAGTNDIGKYGRSAEDIEALHAILWDEIRKKIPKSRLFVVSLLPRQNSADHPFREVIKSTNSKLRLAASKAGCIFIDVHDLFVEKSGSLKMDWMPDQLHLNDDGYRLLLPLLKKFLYPEEKLISRGA